ncbi:MAG TPA: metallophosphoesterase family protein [Lysobacter sp.]
MHVGLISDTHGLMRPEAFDALRDCERILHAGDIGDPGILATLETIAPVTAIRGNNDTADWARDLPEARVVQLGDVAVYMLHDLKELAVRPAGRHVDVILAGHSHKPRVDTREGVLIVNPGSAGRRRFRLPISVARLRIDGRRVETAIVELDV